MSYSDFKIYANSVFRDAKHPDNVLKNDQFVNELAYWYNLLTNDILKTYGCGVCLYERFAEIVNYTDQHVKKRKEMKYIIKENEVIYYKNTHYSRKSPHLTDEIMLQIAEKHPTLVEPNPNFEQVQESEPETEQTEQPVKQKRTRKQRNNG
jgi:hypothetical protein